MFPENCYAFGTKTNEVVVIDLGCFAGGRKAGLENLSSRMGLNEDHEYPSASGPYSATFMLKEFGQRSKPTRPDEFWIDGAEQSRMFWLPTVGSFVPWALI